ncbi:MAG: hypothetical protein IJP66_06955 [Kiritimatiellae bacterium]|nr:hypothetical protein [Kiritimatiellia bacterium]
MAFEVGNPSFRLFKCGEEINEGLIEAFRRRLAPRPEAITAAPMEAWAGWRHLLDRDLDEDHCLFIPWLYISRMKSERKIPKALLRSYCRLEEAEALKKSGAETLAPAARAEIRERIIGRLTPDMPPTLTGYGVVVDFATGAVYAEATSAKAAEAFAEAFKSTSGHTLAALNPETVAVLRKGVNANDLESAVFTDDESVEIPERCSLGLEFLTWMWYSWEEEADAFENTRGDRVEYLMEGPVAFYNEGKGAHTVVIRNGLPLQSREAGAALLCGKKVRKIKFSMATAAGAWTATLDSDFTFGGVKLPKERGGGKQTVQERMGLLDTFVESVFSLYDKFLDLRSDAHAWARVEKKMRAWVRRRAEMADGDITLHARSGA